MSSARAFFSDPSWLVRRTSFLKVGFAAPDERGCIAWSESWTGRSLFFAPIGCQNQLTTASTAVFVCSGMSVDHSVVPFTRSEERSQPVFLSVKAGMTVICGDSNSDDWWMADVIHVDGSARDPKVPTLFQVADVDAGLVRWVCADLVTHIVTRC